MPDSNNRPEPARFSGISRREAIDCLHRQCGIYTRPSLVNTLLDAIGWEEHLNLSKCRLLEPAAGDGAFVAEAARRLVNSCYRNEVSPTARVLRNCIRAFELHTREARKAQRNVAKAIRQVGVSKSTATVLARAWIRNADFLLASGPAAPYTHVVGNPPYIRWAKIPTALRNQYARKLPRSMIGGDLFIPFLDRSLEQLCSNGQCPFLCSDRWHFMAFAAPFRAKWLPQLQILSSASVLAKEAYVREVDAYPSILVAKRTDEPAPPIPALRRRMTIKDFGFRIKVGPALGVTLAFVLQREEREVEEELLWPWVDTSEITEGKILWSGRRVIVMYGKDGSLIDLAKFPLTLKRLERFRPVLSNRSIVLNGSPWFRTIDRVCAADWERPKLLIPEIAKVPRIAFDNTGSIPSHGVYAIFAPDDNLNPLYDRLANGGLAAALAGIAPKIKGGYVRCYKRFLEQITFFP
jgi:hypothetical protein